MKHYLLVFFVAIMLFACNKDENTGDKYQKEGTLRELSEQNNTFLIGSLFNYSYIFNTPDHEIFSQTIADEFNIISGEWELGMESIWVGPGLYNFRYADSLMQFAKNNNQKVKWTHLVWHGSLPEFAEFYNYSDAEFETEVLSYIDTVMKHCKTYFPDVVHDYNVVNEVIDHYAQTMFRQSIFLDKMGNDFVQKCFEQAHSSDPDAKLYICEYGILGNRPDNQPKTDLMYSLVNQLVSNGVAIDGVAEQCHNVLEDFEDMDFYEEVMESYADLDLKFQISEFTIEINESGDGKTEEKLQKQAEKVTEIFELCRTKPYVEAIIFWGLTDAHTYLGTNEYPVLFDEDYQPKPAYFAAYNALK